MPVIELDILIAFVNRIDKLHSTASKIFDSIASGRLSNIAVPTSAYVEYELVLRSRGYSEDAVSSDIHAFRSIRNLGEFPLTSRIIVEASKLRVRYGLTYFDSLHAASALNHDKTIISTDKIYREVKELRAVDPRELVDM